MPIESTLQTFSNDDLGASIRVIDRVGEPWFVAKDVCDALDIRTDSLRAILDGDEICTINPNSIGVPSGGRDMLVISEPGLYSLILRSRKPEAKAFKRWVTHDVLPSIRKHGAYMTPATLDKMLADPRLYAELLTNLANERERRELLEDREAVFGNRTPFGILSNTNGRPRTEPVHGYLRTTRTTTTTIVTERQLRLFDFD